MTRTRVYPERVQHLVDIGHRFITSSTESGWRLCFHSCLSVCLCTVICEPDISKSSGWIPMKCGGCVMMMNLLYLSEYPDPE